MIGTYKVIKYRQTLSLQAYGGSGYVYVIGIDPARTRIPILRNACNLITVPHDICYDRLQVVRKSCAGRSLILRRESGNIMLRRPQL